MMQSIRTIVIALGINTMTQSFSLSLSFALLLYLAAFFQNGRMTIAGLKTVHELREIPCIPFEPLPKVKQELCVARSERRRKTYGKCAPPSPTSRSALRRSCAETDCWQA